MPLDPAAKLVILACNNSDNNLTHKKVINAHECVNIIKVIET